MTIYWVTIKNEKHTPFRTQDEQLEYAKQLHNEGYKCIGFCDEEVNNSPEEKVNPYYAQAQCYFNHR